MLSARDIEQLRFLLGRRIRLLRKRVSLTQEQLARRVQMERSRLSRIEHGSRTLTFNELAVIADEFDLSLSELFEGVVLATNWDTRVLNCQDQGVPAGAGVRLI